MNNNDNIFSKEYSIPTETKSKQDKVKEIEPPKEIIFVEQNRYELGKPRRVIIRAKITHDKD